MTTLNASFKKQIKTILLDKYDITCYKIVDISSPTRRIMVFQLFCIAEGQKFSLYLDLYRPDDEDDSGQSQELEFNVSAQGRWLTYIPAIERKIYLEELNESFEQFNNILQSLNYHVELSARRADSISLFNGKCLFSYEGFNIVEISTYFFANNQIYAYSPEVHHDMKLCEFIISGNTIQFSNKSSKLEFMHDVTTENSVNKLSESLLKHYVVLLKNKFDALSDVSVSDVAHSSCDDLKNILTLFKIERI